MTNLKTTLFALLAASVPAAWVPGGLVAQTDLVALPEFATYSPRVAIQEPVGTFATPVSALSFDPMVDVESRGSAETQADVTVRGGIFDNTGFRIGGVSLYDPQTGHYSSNVPVDPNMLSAPQIMTGVDNAVLGFDANVGTVDYGWSPVRMRGLATVGFGDYGTNWQNLYQGYVSEAKVAGQSMAMDASFSHSGSNGSVPFGDHSFYRFNTRLQFSDGTTQTDLFYAYQSQFYGWPDLYTPFNVDETENLQTNLLMLNHRVSFGGDGYLQIGAYYRRNKDHYEFDRFIPGLYGPYQHTTWVYGTGLDGRYDFGAFTLDFSGDAMADNLKSTTLIYGHFHTRDYAKLSLVPERSWQLDATHRLTLKAGATYDGTNRDGSVISPMAEAAIEQVGAGGGTVRTWLGYAETAQVPDYTALNSSPTGGLFRGNPNLSWETSRNLELGVSATQEGWKMQADVFYRRDDNLVDWTYNSASPAARTANAVNIATGGFEARFTRRTRDWDVTAGYTYLTKSADYGLAEVTGSFYALNFPHHRFTLAVTGRLGGGFEVRMDNQYRVQAANPLRTEGGNDALLSSLGVYYRPPRFSQIEFSVQADNLWNSSFQEVPAVPAAGREISGGVSYAW